MGRKSLRVESDTDMEDGGAKLNAPVDDAMDIDSAPAPVVDKKKAAADARAERAARRKQRREELAAQGQSASSSLASTPNPENVPATPNKNEKKTRRKKVEKKTTPKKSEEAAAETEAPVVPATTTEPSAAEAHAPAPALEPANQHGDDAEPLPFVIDVKPSKAVVAEVDTGSPPLSEKGTSIAPSSVNGDGLNRAARRRLMQIERHRNAIKKELGIPADSDERQAEVDKLLAEWTAQFDEKAEARAAKKLAKKELGKGKRQGKLLTGRNNYEKQKQIKKQKRKEALRLRQEAGSGTS